MKKTSSTIIAAVLFAGILAPLLFAQADFPSLEPAFVYETSSPSLSGDNVIRAGLACRTACALFPQTQRSRTTLG